MTSILPTHDGTFLLTDRTGTSSFPTREAADAEVRRRKCLRGLPEGAALTVTKHTEIQTGEKA